MIRPNQCQPMLPKTSAFNLHGLEWLSEWCLLWLQAQYGEKQVQLTNLAGVQLLTDTHIMRAPDSRWAEPEEIIHASLAVCQGPPKSKCTNDNNGLHGKTFVRSSLAHGLWTHGGSVKGDFGPHRADEWCNLLMFTPLPPSPPPPFPGGPGGCLRNPHPIGTQLP